MRHIDNIYVFFAALFLLFSSCAKVQDIEVPERGTGTKLLGMGVEMDPHFFSQNLTRNDGATEEDWYGIVVPRVEKMDIQRFRVMLQPHWWEPYNDNDDPFVADTSRMTFGSIEVESVCRVLDMVEAMPGDRSVTLVLWGCPKRARCHDAEIGEIGEHFLVEPTGTNWVTRCNDDEEFAENFITFVKWLVQDKGYTCVKEITPYNEPDGNVSEWDTYIPTAKALASRLEMEGLAGRVNLNLSDNTDVRTYFLRHCTAELAGEAALFNSHTYIFGYDDPNRKAYRWERRNVRLARRAGKPHFVGEFGSDLCVGATRQTDINWYERGVLLTRNVINFLNAGASGASYWGLIDQYYSATEDYIQMQQLGLWRYKTCAYEEQDLDPAISREDYACRPQYYAYSLLTRFIRKGDEVYPLNLRGGYAAGTSILGADGKWTYVFANASDTESCLNVSNPHCGEAEFDEYLYSREALPEDDSMIAASECLMVRDSGVLSVCVPSKSVVVLKQK